jgi:esterase/lipase
MNPTASDIQTAAPDQRMARKYLFDDPTMDLFFMSALSWGPTGGLDIGQAFHVASSITDGDGDSWVQSFAAYGDMQNAQADTWALRGRKRAAGEARLKAFASYRSAWQFAAPGGATFNKLYGQHQAAFATAMDELNMPASFFQVPYQGKALPGLFLRNTDANAPVVLVIGGADTCPEDLFLSLGKSLLERGYSVAIADLPGQGNRPSHGLYWETEPEQSISAVVDTLVQDFGAQPGRIALLGMSLGGYFVTRAAGHEPRFATVIATTPFPEPGELFSLTAGAAVAQGKAYAPSVAQQRNSATMFWKSGATTLDAFLGRWDGVRADPSLVTVPFLSILGGGDSPVFTRQARAWHLAIPSTRKELVFLDAASGADGHCQVNARLRLVQEASGWMDEIFADAVQQQGSAA